MATFGDLQQQEDENAGTTDTSDEEYVPGKGSDDDDDQDDDAEASSGGDSDDGEAVSGQGTKKVVKGPQRRRRQGKKKSSALPAVRGARRGGICLEGDDSSPPAAQPEEAAIKPEKAKEEESAEPQQDDRAERRADSLWSNFLSDVKRPAASSASAPLPKAQQPEPRVVAKVFDFAGEAVSVPVTAKRPAGAAAAAGGGVRGLLDRLTKRPKLSTLEKSRLDWEAFKSAEGIAEDLATHNRGRAGYLERREFLERADYRQFERERDARHKARGGQGGGGAGQT